MPRNRVHAARFTGALAVLVACGSGSLVQPPVEDRCPLDLDSEFPPTDCAIVRGVARDLNGQFLIRRPIRVDSVIRRVAYVYTSNTATTDDEGRFSLIVVRSARLVPPTDPDTATVELKTYSSPAPNAGDVPIARAPVRMMFAELGKLVTPTVVEAVFDIRF